MCVSGWVAWRPRDTSQYDAATETVQPPAEHAAVLADEGGPFFVGAAFQLTCPNSRNTTASRTHSDPAAGLWSPHMLRIWGRAGALRAGWVEHL